MRIRSGLVSALPLYHSTHRRLALLDAGLFFGRSSCAPLPASCVPLRVRWVEFPKQPEREGRRSRCGGGTIDSAARQTELEERPPVLFKGDLRIVEKLCRLVELSPITSNRQQSCRVRVNASEQFDVGAVCCVLRLHRSPRCSS